MNTVELDDFEILILLSGLRRDMRSSRLFAGSFGNDRAKVLYEKLEQLQLQSERDSNVNGH